MSKLRTRVVLYICCALILLALAYEAKESSNSTFVTRDGIKFVFNGSAFLFNGFNSYWLMSVAADPSARYKVSEVFENAAGAGLTVCRTWAFSDGGGGQALQVSPGQYNEEYFQALDFVISEARKYGIHLILSLVNNYNDYGGRKQYVQWARNAGLYLNGDDDFYTNYMVKTYFKNYIKKMLSRVNTITKIAYKDDPTIMAWELINEPRCISDPSSKTLQGWVQEMASYLKSIDKKHLLGIGMEGFYGDSVPEKKQYNPNNVCIGTDYISTHLITEIDYATIHSYPNFWLAGSNDAAQIAFTQKWLWSHWDDTVKTINKPLVLGEFGKSSKEPRFNNQIRDAYIGAIYNDMYKYARNFHGSVGGGLVWQLLAQDMEPSYDGFEILLSQDSTTRDLMLKQSQAMAKLARNLAA